ncbi:hypothetical protein MUK42_01792 [Musa troglodytarum]|uniref:Uncharacterized protein n=1 Tax=Musa troglodytarum TaxID=320322 RepID=A0A9E7FGL1_9LILI|nr:hypothetical protein MUK42_01792 [Musa troglodytarum]URD93861.1 hypothetical protein MUK42_01792 [Musa troglodytarum]URD93862.1 hypothetical protein MUK42_01792 [Musa troglodytarum]
MGTNVQYKCYLSGYHPMEDLDEDKNFSWSPFSEDKSFSWQLCNDFKPRTTSSWSKYDKETLKQTMLEHEATFQNQVYELHRLYRIQRELMYEIKRKQLNRFSGPTQTSKSNGDDKRPSFNFLKKGVTQCSSISTANGGCVTDDRPFDAKFKMFPKRTLDLHLPAEVYIKNEGTEKQDRENIAESCAMAVENRNINCAVETENDVMSTLEVPLFGIGTLKSNLHPKYDLSIHSLVDLNEPIKDSCEKGAISSSSHKSCGMNVHYKELCNPWEPMSFRSRFPDRIFSMDKHRGVGTFNYFDTDKVERRQEWPLLHNDSGERKIAVNCIDSGLFSAKSSEAIKLKLDKSQESQFRDQNQTQTWFGEKTTHSRTQDFVNSEHPGYTASQVISPLLAHSSFSHATATSPVDSSWRNPSEGIHHIPVEVQALQCSSRPSMLNGLSINCNAHKQRNSIGRDKLQSIGDLQQHLRVGNRSSYVNGLYHGSQMYSISLNGTHLSPSNLEMPNLNKNGDSPPFGNSEIYEPQKCLKDLQFAEFKSAKDSNLNEGILVGIQDVLADKQNLARKHDESSKGSIWLRGQPSFNDSTDPKKGCDSQLDLRFIENCSHSPELLGQDVKDKDSSICVFKQSVPSFDIKESRIQRSAETEINPPDNSKTIFYYTSSVSYYGQSLVDNAKGNRECKAVRNCIPIPRNDINLNYELMPIDDVSADVETCTPSPLSLAMVARKPSNKIDLEATADEMKDNNIFHGVEIIDMNHPVTPTEISKEKISSHDTCMRLTADTILSMKVDVHTHLDNVTCYPSAPSPCDSLHLLAEVITFNGEIAGQSEGGRYDCCEASDNDVFDVFEYMTLKLEEVKADDSCCKQCQNNKQNNEGKSMASLLFTRPRRGQARKRRQRRDFQKDILPALASLSRHEVMEDLQALGGKIRASKSRQTSSTKRSTSSCRSSVQLRGRWRQPRSLAITVTEVHDSPPQLQPIHTELETDGLNVMAWGRTTRRCRRQRILSRNVSAPRE